MVIKSTYLSGIKHTGKVALVALLTSFFHPMHPMMSKIKGNNMAGIGGKAAQSLVNPRYSHVFPANNSAFTPPKTYAGTQSPASAATQQASETATYPLIPTDNSWQAIGLTILGNAVYDNALQLASLAYSGAKVAGKITVKTLNNFIKHHTISTQQFNEAAEKLKQPLMPTQKKVVQKTTPAIPITKTKTAKKRPTMKEVRKAAQEYKKLLDRKKAQEKRKAQKKQVTPQTVKQANAQITASRNAMPEPIALQATVMPTPGVIREAQQSLLPTTVPMQTPQDSNQFNTAPSTNITSINPQQEEKITIMPDVSGIQAMPPHQQTQYPVVPVTRNSTLLQTAKPTDSNTVTIDLTGTSQQEQDVITRVAEIFKKSFEEARTKQQAASQPSANNQFALVPVNTHARQSNNTTHVTHQAMADVWHLLQQQQIKLSKQAQKILVNMTHHFNSTMQKLGGPLGKKYSITSTAQQPLMLEAPAAPAAVPAAENNQITPPVLHNDAGENAGITPDHVIQEYYRQHDAGEPIAAAAAYAPDQPQAPQEIQPQLLAQPTPRIAMPAPQRPNNRDGRAAGAIVGLNAAALLYKYLTQVPTPIPTPDVHTMNPWIAPAAVGALVAATHIHQWKKKNQPPVPSNNNKQDTQQQPARQNNEEPAAQVDPVKPNDAPAVQPHAPQPNNNENPAAQPEQPKHTTQADTPKAATEKQAMPPATKPVPETAHPSLTQVKARLRAIIQTISNPHNNGIYQDINWATQNYCAWKQAKRASCAATLKTTIMQDLTQLKESLADDAADTATQLVDTCIQDVNTLFDTYIKLYNECPQRNYKEHLSRYASQTIQLRTKVQNIITTIGH